MELRHLRYFLAVGEASNFTRAAAQLGVTQPTLSRQLKHLEDEIGVDLLRRSPRGVTLTPGGKLFLEEVRKLLKRTGEAVEKVRALARDEYCELRVGYMSTPTMEILPPGLAAFRKSLPHAEVFLYDLSSNELVTGLRNATLELAIMVQPIGEQAAGIEFELLRAYPLGVAVPPVHPFARLKSIPFVTGERLLYRPVTGKTVSVSIGIAHAIKSDLTPAGKKFCEMLRKTSVARAMPERPKAVRAREPIRKNPP
jgi:DNA-binding transcriptional LysR family regulator